MITFRKGAFDGLAFMNSKIQNLFCSWFVALVRFVFTFRRGKWPLHSVRGLFLFRFAKPEMAGARSLFSLLKGRGYTYGDSVVVARFSDFHSMAEAAQRNNLTRLGGFSALLRDRYGWFFIVL